MKKLVCALTIGLWPHLLAFGQTYGLTTINAYFLPGQEVYDAFRARYKCRVAADVSPTIKILFGWHRFYGINPDTYLLETNLYSDGIRYVDPVCTTWPLVGEYRPAEASLRVAVPDYNLKGKTGAKTLNPLVFPRQTYEIDGIPGLWKTDMISQLNLTGKDCTVEIVRGNLIVDKTGWKCTGTLDNDLYREWDVFVTIDSVTYTQQFALPDSSARYFTSYEILQFGSEFLHTQGLSKIYLWDLEIQKEGTSDWLPLRDWKVVQQDGPTTDFGSRLALYNNMPVIEISNEKPGPFFPKDTIFTLACIAKPGDANSSGGNPNLADIIYLVNFLFKGGPIPSPFCRGDANADGGITIPDIIYLVNHVFKGGPASVKSGLCCL